MNANQLINMAIRMLMRKGIDLAATTGKRPQDMTQAERQTAADARQTGQKARKGINLIRRFMR